MQTGIRQLRPLLLVSFLFFAQFSVAMYVNSTALERFVGAEYTSLFYVFGAVGSIVLLFLLPKLIKANGLVRVAICIYLLLALSVLILGTTALPLVFTSAFVLYTALTSTVWYSDDLFVAHYTDSATAGRTRGMYLTITNTAIAIMPVIAGVLVSYIGINSVYIVSAVLLTIAVAIVAYTQRSFVDHQYNETTIGSAWNTIRHSSSLRRVLSINFLLQFFYAWMTIYTPLYMAVVLHFSWTQIGAAFSFMLIPFILLQYKVGAIADRIGEKALLLAGLAIMTISTVAFALLGAQSIVIYALVLFCTRVGAALVEVLSETYFFKQMTDKDESVISVFRMMRPLSYVIAPLAGWYIIATTSYTVLFYLLGAALLLGMLYAIRLPAIKKLAD